MRVGDSREGDPRRWRPTLDPDDVASGFGLLARRIENVSSSLEGRAVVREVDELFYPGSEEWVALRSRAFRNPHCPAPDPLIQAPHRQFWPAAAEQLPERLSGLSAEVAYSDAEPYLDIRPMAVAFVEHLVARSRTETAPEARWFDSIFEKHTQLAGTLLSIGGLSDTWRLSVLQRGIEYTRAETGRAVTLLERLAEALYTRSALDAALGALGPVDIGELLLGLMSTVVSLDPNNDNRSSENDRQQQEADTELFHQHLLMRLMEGAALSLRRRNATGPTVLLVPSTEFDRLIDRVDQIEVTGANSFAFELRAMAESGRGRRN